MTLLQSTLTLSGSASSVSKRTLFTLLKCFDFVRSAGDLVEEIQTLRLLICGLAVALICVRNWNIAWIVLKRTNPTLPNMSLVDFGHMRSREKSVLRAGSESIWKEDRYFFREGGVGKNRARLSEDQEARIVERVHAELTPECAEFVLALTGER